MKLRKGDKVVVYKPEEDGYWHHEMDQYVGKQFVVEYRGDDGFISLEGCEGADGDRYCFEEAVLLLVL